jgi:hypothetical protein
MSDTSTGRSAKYIRADTSCHIKDSDRHAFITTTTGPTDEYPGPWCQSHLRARRQALEAMDLMNEREMYSIRCRVRVESFGCVH